MIKPLLRLAKVSRALGQAQNQKGSSRGGLGGGVKLISSHGHTAVPDQANNAGKAIENWGSALPFARANAKKRARPRPDPSLV